MKNLLRRLRNSKRGFSLVELIVVIAIMAVIAAVLVPSLLMHVEESRAEKDIKTTDEVVTAVELALADQDVYDELVEHSVFDNVSCYVDKDSESGYERVVIKETYNGYAEQYKFDDDARQNDEVPYYGAGNMRGLTITFSPEKDSNESTYELSRGIINRFVGRKTGYLYENEKLYNAIRSVVGDKIYNSSQTYRNSDFTIFIRLGSTGGNEAGNQDATQVWGQYNGTNLPSDTVQTAKITTDRVIGDAGQYDAAVNDYINDEANTNIDFSQLAQMGNSNFGEKLESNKSNIPGLYDKDGNLVASWERFEELGFKVEENNSISDMEFVSYFPMAINYDLMIQNFGEEMMIQSGVTSELRKTSKIVIPDSVTKIGHGAFHSFLSVKEIILPNTLTEIGAAAFASTGITQITIPDGVTELKNHTYDNGPNLEGLFDGCPLLTVNLSSNIKKIGTGVFHECTSLKEINYSGTKTQWENINLGNGWNYGCPEITVHCTDEDIVIPITNIHPEHYDY